MADQLTETQISDFKKVFSLFDRNDKEQIPTEELGTVLRILGKIPSEAFLNEIIREVDGKRTGFVDFSDFLTIVTRDIKDSYHDEEEIREAFRIFDKEEKGLISVEDFRHLLVHLGENMKEEEISRMLTEASQDSVDGLVDYEKFVTTITKMEPTYNYKIPQTCPKPKKECF